MASELLGRTNAAFPKAWHRLVVPPNGNAEGVACRLAQAAVESGSVIDITTSPAFWGGLIRGTTATLMVCGAAEVEIAPSERLACDWVQAHLIEALSAVGREWFDFYFLRVRSSLSEHQLNGALLALDNARQEGHVKHLGVDCLGDDDSVLRTWSQRDAFEVALIHRPGSRVIEFARERRVGIVTGFPSEHTTLLPFTEDSLTQVAR